MDRNADSWRFVEGDAISPALTVLRLLGGGEAYEAYLAFDELTYSPVVVKVVRPAQVGSSSTLRSLRREIETLGSVHHPAVVRALRADAEADRPHVVLEQLDGPRLSTLIRRHGPLEARQYLPLAIEVAAALHYLAHVGYVHLDIKPSNVIMGAPAKLIDLSIARTTEHAAALTYPVGTDAYMAPEQCAPPSTGVPCFASDVWGLGATLFEAIAGYRAFDAGDSSAEDLAKRFPQLVEEPHDLPSRVPADIGKLVFACLTTDPTYRPTPAELADAFGPILARQPKGRLAGFKVGQTPR
jgi:serine/threonine protein kinase